MMAPVETHALRGPAAFRCAAAGIVARGFSRLGPPPDAVARVASNFYIVATCASRGPVRDVTVSVDAGDEFLGAARRFFDHSNIRFVRCHDLWSKIGSARVPAAFIVIGDGAGAPSEFCRRYESHLRRFEPDYSETALRLAAARQGGRTTNAGATFNQERFLYDDSEGQLRVWAPARDNARFLESRSRAATKKGARPDAGGSASIGTETGRGAGILVVEDVSGCAPHSRLARVQFRYGGARPDCIDTGPRLAAAAAGWLEETFQAKAAALSELWIEARAPAVAGQFVDCFCNSGGGLDPEKVFLPDIICGAQPSLTAVDFLANAACPAVHIYAAELPEITVTAKWAAP